MTRPQTKVTQNEEEIAQWLESQAHVLRRISPDASEALKGAANSVRSGTYRKRMEDDDTETT